MFSYGPCSVMVHIQSILHGPNLILTLMETDLKRICIQITNRQYQSLKDRSSPGKSMSSLIRSALETEEVIKKSNKDLLIPILNDSKQLSKIERLTNEFY